MQLRRIQSSTAVLALPLLVLTGCPREQEELTAREAKLAVQEASDAGQAEGLASASVDIATKFTIGQAAREGAEEIRDFIEAQLACADVALDGTTLRVVYGARAGGCSYRGHQFSGTHEIRIERNDDDAVVVHHEWIDFSNGVVALDGSAQVTWSSADETRRVEHESHWTHLASGRVGTGSGDRQQSALDGGIAEGIRIDGSRTWDGEQGHWDLAIDDVEIRWTDPVPQSGSYTLTTPAQKSVRMSFGRDDDDTIRVTVAGPRRDFSFTVSKLGSITEQP